MGGEHLLPPTDPDTCPLLWDFQPPAGAGILCARAARSQGGASSTPLLENGWQTRPCGTGLGYGTVWGLSCSPR